MRTVIAVDLNTMRELADEEALAALQRYALAETTK